MARPASTTVPFAEVAAVLGEKKALQLCRLYHGRRLPSIVQFLRERRDEAIKRDWDAGAQVGELSAKYGLSRANIEVRLLQWTKEAQGIPTGHGRQRGAGNPGETSEQ